MLSFRYLVVSLLLYTTAVSTTMSFGFGGSPNSWADSRPAAPPEQDFISSGPLIRVSTDTLWITEESVEVASGIDIKPEQLESLLSGEVGVLLRSSERPEMFLSPTADSVQIVPDAKLPDHSGSYQNLLGRLIQLLSRDADRSLRIVAGPNRLSDAQSVYEALARSKYIRANQLGIRTLAPQSDSTGNDHGGSTGLSVTPPLLRFQTSEGLQRAAVASWRLQIRDSNGEVVKSIAASGAFPGEMIWDWKNSDGELAKSAFYSYSVNWTSVDGTVHTAVAGYIKVIRRVRRITLRLARSLTEPLSDHDALFLIVR
jgi:voltage-gated potassium channel Kch